MIVFGGLSQSGCQSTLYKLSLSVPHVWSTIETTGAIPGQRKGHSAVMYGGKLWIVFGANGHNHPYRDVHVLDISKREWVRIEPKKGIQHPRARSGHSTVLWNDTINKKQKLLLFGGMVAQHELFWAPASENSEGLWLADLWEYDFDFSTWTCLFLPRLSQQHPEGRYSQLAWATSDHFYIFGGDSCNCTVYYNDVWRFDLRSKVWQAIAICGDLPSPRSGHIGVAVQGQLIVFGGELPIPQSDGSATAEYSSELFLMPHFSDKQTSLFETMSRYLVFHSLSRTNTGLCCFCNNQASFR